MSYTIVNLKQKAALQQAIAGGKGANLARLLRDGFHVPPGFVITCQAFQDFLIRSDLQGVLQHTTPSEHELAQIRQELVGRPIPGTLTRSIVRAYQRLGGSVAVRSSMVGEDAKASSFAGQLDTVLNVEGHEALLEAVKTCWASLFGLRLWHYLAERDAAMGSAVPSPFAMAVVVQRMIDAQVAGVASSADPLTGQPCVVVEATGGLGDALVQGLVAPDRYVVDVRGTLVSRTTPGEGAGTLPDAEVQHLAEIVRSVATTMDGPQDVEWAWDGSDFHLLQSRPITALVGQRVYSRSMVGEMLPGLIKPLVWSVSATSKLENVLGRIFSELGGPDDVDLRRLATRIHSRVYADTTMLGQLLEHMGLPPNFFEVMSRDEKAARRRRPPMNSRTLRTMLRMARFGWRHSRIADEITAFVERHSRALEPYRRADWSARSPQELLAHFDELAILYSETLWYNFVGPLNMMGRNRMMARLVQRHAPDVAPSDLIRGLTGLKSLESHRALQGLAAQARALGDEIPSLLVDHGEEIIRATLSRSPEGQSLVSQVDAFLDRYGFLSTCGTDLSRMPWCENPTLIWRAIGRMASHVSPSHSEDAQEIREGARARVRANLSPLQRLIFDRLLRSTLIYIDLREKSSFLVSEDSFEMRRLLLALADRFVARGDLRQGDDIFYLTLDEVRELVAGTRQIQEVQALIVERQREMEIDAGLELPDTIYGEHVPTEPIALTPDQEYLTGIGCSSGLTQGYARVVLDPSEVQGGLTREHILVIPFADVSWTPLFSGVSGVVAETGGQLSHSAIVAREYGLPAVVNVRHAIHLIQDGQFIRLDGSNGRVYLR